MIMKTLEQTAYEQEREDLVSLRLKNPKRKQDTTSKQKSITEQELISMLSQLCPVAIVITPQTWEDGRTVYAWRAWESSGTHPAMLGAVQAALEAAMGSLVYAPVSPEARLSQADFPPTGGFWMRK
jgi:hypothetical protein